MKSFIFIIPLTPLASLNETRLELWKFCAEALIYQTYPYWQALIIGEISVLNRINDDRFISIDFEGRKEEKLQKATDFIMSNNTPGNYIIRLDDDDIINPEILSKITAIEFDLYVDKYQWFWHYESGKISHRVWSWFPNTCVHKREHALSTWGDFAKGEFRHYKEKALLIENDHSKLHSYYSDKKVCFAKKNNPVYLRSITSSSITATNADNHFTYLKRFGNWQNNHLKSFEFLNEIEHTSQIYKLNLMDKVKNRFIDLKSSLNYMNAINLK